MVKTGTIINIEPTGSYPGHSGTIYTFAMVIRFPDGDLKGEIGSKSEAYPLSMGSEITVDVTSDPQYGIKFKRVNQFGPQQRRQRPQNAAQRPNGKQPDWDAISRGKVRHGVTCAFIQSGTEPTIDRVEYWVDYIMNGPPSRSRQMAQEFIHDHNLDGEPQY